MFVLLYEKCTSLFICLDCSADNSIQSFWSNLYFAHIFVIFLDFFS